MVTNSIVAVTDESYEIISKALESCENELSLSDIALLPDYANILFDCEEKSSHAFMEILRTKYSDAAWRLMMSEGETIKSIFVFDGKSFTAEAVGKTMDEIAAESRFSCSGNCSECSSDCNHSHVDGCSCTHIHGEECDCDEYRAEAFSLDDTVEMFNEIAQEPEDVFYQTLVNAYLEELNRFVSEQSAEDDVLDIFLNSIAQIVISAAACDGSYTLREHGAVEQLIGETDFDRMKKSLADIIPDNESLCRSLGYWRETERYGYEMRRYILMLCTFVCCVDGEVNEKEYAFLNMLTTA